MELAVPKNYEHEWQTFLNKINDYANDPPEKWTILTLLSYFIVKYKLVNDIDFIFSSCKKGPTQSKEMKDAAKIWNMFDSGRYKNIVAGEEKNKYKCQLVDILREYIDWAFDVKFRGRQTNVTGLGIFALANFMNEFLQWRKAKKNTLPKRGDPLPQQFIEWVIANVPSILTRQQLSVLEDLNSIYNYVEAYKLDDASTEVIVLKKARELGIMPKIGKLELNRK